MSAPAITEKQMVVLQKMMSTEFYLSPLKFCLWNYSWGSGDLKNFKGPRKWQREIMLDIERYLTEGLQQKKITGSLPDFFRAAVASGRGPGKSALVGMLAHWFISTRIGGSTWVAANGEPQLRTKTFPEIAKWFARGMNADFFEIASTSITPARWFKEFIESEGGLNKNTRYYYVNGQLWSAENPDAFAGAHNFDGEFAIFDEASGVPDPIWTVQEGVFTEDIIDRFWLVFSNPRKNTGAFCDCFHAHKKQWRTYQIDSRSVEGISHTPFENIIEKYGEDSDEAKVEVYGQFPSVGDDQFISPKLVDEALDRLPVEEPGAPIVLGVDVARFGNDKTVITARKGSVRLAVRKYTGLDTMAVCGKVIEAMKEWKPDLTIIDEGGLGAGVLDRLKEQGYKVRGVSFGSRADNPIAYFNKRSEMWGAMRDWLRTASLGSLGDNAAAENKATKADLTAPRYKSSSNGSIVLESKADMKKRGIHSTDEGDSLALTLAYPVGSGALDTQKIRVWTEEIPRFSQIIQSYYGDFLEQTAGVTVSASVWGVFENKGTKRVMLVDTWSEKMSYAEMRAKIIKDWHSEYGTGDQRARKTKANLVLLGQKEVGELMIHDMHTANIIVPKYPAGDTDLIERAHHTASILNEGCVYFPESTSQKGKVIKWSRGLIEQCDRFPNDEETGLVNTMCRAINYIKDAELLEMPVAALDEPEDDTFDYSKRLRPNINPYAA